MPFWKIWISFSIVFYLFVSSTPRSATSSVIGWLPNWQSGTHLVLAVPPNWSMGRNLLLLFPSFTSYTWYGIPSESIDILPSLHWMRLPSRPHCGISLSSWVVGCHEGMFNDKPQQPELRVPSFVVVDGGCISFSKIGTHDVNIILIPVSHWMTGSPLRDSVLNWPKFKPVLK